MNNGGYTLDNLTPMMKQYMSLKSQHEDTILFFRLGDFYEMFFEDAITASRELEISLTQRDCGMEEKAPMCGVPHHVADNYIARLVNKGYKVAIAEQVEDPSKAKGLVKREVIKIVTPGTITDENILKEKSNNFLTSIYFDELGAGISYVDNSTGEMYTAEYSGYTVDDNYRFIINELGKIRPSEIICNKKFLLNKKHINIIKNKINPFFNIYEEQTIQDKNLGVQIKQLFHPLSLNKLNLEGKIYSILSTDKLIQYLYNTQKNTLEHINDLIYYKNEDYMIIDINTRTNLEIHETIMSKQKIGTLIHIMDKTTTPMGGRLLKKWLDQPLLDVAEINRRLDMVEYFLNNSIIRDDFVELLNDVYDIERLASKLSNNNGNGRDLLALKRSISILPELKSLLMSINEHELTKIGKNIDTLEDIFRLLEDSIDENPPISITEGGLIKSGYNDELDTIRDSSSAGKDWLAELELREREKTGIKNLRIGYNKIVGYYFEVTKSNIPMVPEYFTRKQTLTNSERYFTDELKDMESKILGNNDRALELEYEIFIDIREQVKSEVKRLQYTSKLIAKIDTIISFAKTAHENNFSRPVFNNEGYIDIAKGRHPVVEQTVEGNLFVPNSTYIDVDKNMIQIITGPNMSGKSTYMRQVAIIVLLSQVGAFVPAESANINIVDRIFTRIGAADNLSQGESTFMVEMNEVANIIKEATPNSLIILDEVGRGTSTYDGISIAWAVIEYIATHIKAKTLFATHYHELTQLQSKFDVVENLSVSVEEKGNDITFLRKIVEGSTNKSYGIQVARLAGIKEDIINRANEVLSLIEDAHEINVSQNEEDYTEQLNLADYRKDYFLDKITSIDINELTPMEALEILNNLIQDAINLKET